MSDKPTLKLNTIFNQDCLEGMKLIPDHAVDCIICDLPYQVLNKNNANVQWDRIIPLDLLWQQYLRITKPNAAIVLFCQGMFTARLMMSQPRIWRYNLIWDKCRTTGFLNSSRMPLRSHEDIAVFYRHLPTYNPQMEDLNGRKPNHPQGNGTHNDLNQCYGKIKRIYRQRSYSVNTDSDSNSNHQSSMLLTDKKFPSSILSFRKEHNRHIWHPTQKPLDLIRWLVRTYTNPGDLILDNCMGSGTTAIACIREQRNFIGYETNHEYFCKAMKRINSELTQLSLGI